MLIYVYWILSKQKKEKTNEANKNEHLIKVNKVKKNDSNDGGRHTA